MSIAYPLETMKRAQERKRRIKESDVQSAVLEYLETDPRVAQVWRQNNGAMMAEHNGKKRLIRFARLANGEPVALLDVTGYMRDGRRLDIEVKYPMPKIETIAKWKRTLPSKLHKSAQRFLEQEAAIDNARAVGCVAGFVSSVDEAKSLIDAATK